MTTALSESLRRLAADLSDLDARWALIGGFAVSARAEPRFTRDVAGCARGEDDAGAEALAAALVQRGYGVNAVVEHERTGRLATLRLHSPVIGGVLVDLLFASSGIEDEVVAAAEALKVLPDLTIPVARTPHLVVLKLLARDDVNRPPDAMDLRSLRPVLRPGEADEVRRLASLVVARGFHRDRDVVALGEEFLAEA